jgi:alpha-1,2-mannosyltransferase
LSAAGSQGPLRWFAAVATAFTIVFFVYAGWVTWLNYTKPTGADFVSFWAAGKLVLEGSPQLAYDIAAHRAVEKSVGPMLGLMPFPYPPPYLLLVTPFALMPPWLAFAAWLMVTSAVYYLGTRALISPRYAFANPAAQVNVLIGQNGLLTSGLFIGGASVLGRNPWLGGAILGLLSFKPQLAILVPFAMVAGRQWQALAAAAASAGAALAISSVVFGLDILRSFVAVLPTYVEFIRSGALRFELLVSVYALMRYFALPDAASFAIHIAVALFAFVMTWRAWRQHSDARVPILASASLLVSPYIFTYDALLLTAPLAYLLHARAFPAVALIWALLFVPLLNAALDLNLPNTVPFAALLALWATDRLGRAAAANTRAWTASI